VRHELEDFGEAAPSTLTSRCPTAARPLPGRAAIISPQTTSGVFLAFTSNTAAWVFEAARKLESLGKLKTGWDSYGGRPLNMKSRAITVAALSWLSLQDLPTPAVVLGSEGDVHFEWRARGRELELDLGNAQRLGFVKVHPDGEVEEGQESNSPEMLCGLTSWLMYGETSQKR
jgi:hypothetical protein